MGIPIWISIWGYPYGDPYGDPHMEIHMGIPTGENHIPIPIPTATLNIVETQKTKYSQIAK